MPNCTLKACICLNKFLVMFVPIHNQHVTISFSTDLLHIAGTRIVLIPFDEEVNTSSGK